MWKIKEPEVLNAHPNLIKLMDWLTVEFPDLDVITSARRYTGGVHDTNPLRAVDVRCWDDDDGETVEVFTNTWWDYGKPGKNVCLYHDAGSGKHLHFQVRDETRLRSLNTNERYPM